MAVAAVAVPAAAAVVISAVAVVATAAVVLAAVAATAAALVVAVPVVAAAVVTAVAVPAAAATKPTPSSVGLVPTQQSGSFGTLFLWLGLGVGNERCVHPPSEREYLSHIVKVQGIGTELLAAVAQHHGLVGLDGLVLDEEV